VFYGANLALISKVQLESLKNNLSRFLESYMYNTGLDLISGLIRLLLDDYENADGRSRLESSLKKIAGYETASKIKILGEILKIGRNLEPKNILNLSGSLCKFFDDDDSLKTIHAALGDEYTAYHFVGRANSKLRGIREVLYGRLG